MKRTISQVLILSLFLSASALEQSSASYAPQLTSFQQAEQLLCEEGSNDQLNPNNIPRSAVLEERAKGIAQIIERGNISLEELVLSNDELENKSMKQLLYKIIDISDNPSPKLSTLLKGDEYDLTILPNSDAEAEQYLNQLILNMLEHLEQKPRLAKQILENYLSEVKLIDKEGKLGIAKLFPLISESIEEEIETEKEILEYLRKRTSALHANPLNKDLFDADPSILEDRAQLLATPRLELEAGLIKMLFSKCTDISSELMQEINTKYKIGDPISSKAELSAKDLVQLRAIDAVLSTVADSGAIYRILHDPEYPTFPVSTIQYKKWYSSILDSLSNAYCNKISDRLEHLTGYVHRDNANQVFEKRYVNVRVNSELEKLCQALSENAQVQQFFPENVDLNGLFYKIRGYGMMSGIADFFGADPLFFKNIPDNPTGLIDALRVNLKEYYLPKQ